MKESTTKAWYPIKIQTQFKKVMKNNLTDMLKRFGLTDKVEITIPTCKKITTTKGGQQRRLTRSIYDGYAFLGTEVGLSPDVLKMLTELPQIANYPLSPKPLTPEEVESILGIIKEKQQNPEIVHHFEQGGLVMIIKGVFSDWTGTIHEIKEKDKKVIVAVSVFNEEQFVEVPFSSVRNVTEKEIEQHRNGEISLKRTGNRKPRVIPLLNRKTIKA